MKQPERRTVKAPPHVARFPNGSWAVFNLPSGSPLHSSLFRTETAARDALQKFHDEHGYDYKSWPSCWRDWEKRK